MGATAKGKSVDTKPVDDGLTSEVASFVSSLGFASSTPTSGFDDSDFRKSGRIVSKPPSKKVTSTPVQDEKNKKTKTTKSRALSKPVGASRAFSAGDQSTVIVRKNEKYKNLPKLPLVRADVLDVWYEDLRLLEKKVLGDDYNGKLDVTIGVEEWKNIVSKKREVGDRLMWQYSQAYEMERGRTGDIKMLMASQKSGTAADKVSAFSLLVKDNPIANLRSLDALLGMITSKVGKRHALTGFQTLQEIFISRLLPDRKLKTLLQRPLHKLPETKDGYSLLLFWYWEDCLKQRYERFVSSLEESARDSLPVLKDKAMKTIFELLNNKPEQERKLLLALVNKLGDPQNKGASNAEFLLSLILSKHQNMKLVIIDEVDSFLFRPHLGLRPKYYAVNFLNQIRLSNKGEGPKIAKRLIDVYFAVFKVLINSPNGIPKVDDGGKSDSQNGDHPKKNKVAMSADSQVGLDSRILSALLTGVNRAFPYVSNSETDDVIEDHTPMLFRLAHSDNFNVGIQALMLLEKISSKHHIVSDRFYRALYSKLLLPSVLNSSKGELFTGLLLRALKNDVNLNRISAFSKRILQVALQQPPQYACGCLFVISEVLKARPSLWNLMQKSELDDEDVEVFKDVEEDEAEESLPETVNTRSLDAAYNPRHRDPLFCNADRTSWWELAVLASHVHPSVATMAGTLLSGAYIVYSGNPFIDLSLTAFLDKFMEKKPKQTDWHGAAEIEPAKKMDVRNRLIGSEILSMAEIDVPPEDVVFHKFYTNKMTSSKSKKKKKKKKTEDGDDELLAVDDDEVVGGDDSDDEEIDKMLDMENEDGEYDYDDLDRIVAEDEADDDLVDDGSDAETNIADGLGEEEDASDEEIPIAGDLVEEDDPEIGKKVKSKLKRKRGSGASPFASLEEYEHLINEGDERPDSKPRDKSSRRKKLRPQK